MEDTAPYPRFLSRGRAYAYLLPARDEDIVKVGFSRDPLQRLHALHRRFYEFFDLERAQLLECTRVRDARRIERALIATFADLRAPAPLVVRQLAGGHTEWFRGGHAAMAALLPTLAQANGAIVHAPLHAWLRETLADSSDRLWQWSEQQVAAIDYERFNLNREQRSPVHARVLRDTLDAFDALGFDLPQLVPANVLHWYRSNSLFGDAAVLFPVEPEET